MIETSRAVHPQADLTLLQALTPRESQMLRDAGERVLSLSRRLSEAERSIATLERDLAHARDLLLEARDMRDCFRAQVARLQHEADRERAERVELGRLLVGLQAQLQSLLTLDPRPTAGRLQSGSQTRRRKPSKQGPADRFLRSAFNEFRRLLNSASGARAPRN